MMRSRPAVRGFSLIEVALAVGVAAFCLVAVLGLLPVGINSNQNAIEQTAAANLVRAVVSDLRGTPPVVSGSTYATSGIYGFKIPAAGQIPTANSTKIPLYQTLYFAESAVVTGTSLNSPPVAFPPDPTKFMESAVSRYRLTATFTPPPRAGMRTATAADILVTWPALADQDPTQPAIHYSGSYEVLVQLDRN